jgi:hypothetical protein
MFSNLSRDNYIWKRLYAELFYGKIYCLSLSKEAGPRMHLWPVDTDYCTLNVREGLVCKDYRHYVER